MPCTHTVGTPSPWLSAGGEWKSAQGEAWNGKEKGCCISVWEWNSPKLLTGSSRSSPLRPDPEKNLGKAWDGWRAPTNRLHLCHASTWSHVDRVASRVPCACRRRLLARMGRLSCTSSIAAGNGSAGLICRAWVPRHNPVMPGRWELQKLCKALQMSS